MFRGKLTLDDPVSQHSLHHGSSCLHLITSSGTMLRSFVEPRHLHQPLHLLNLLRDWHTLETGVTYMAHIG